MSKRILSFLYAPAEVRSAPRPPGRGCHAGHGGRPLVGRCAPASDVSSLRAVVLPWSLRHRTVARAARKQLRCRCGENPLTRSLTLPYFARAFSPARPDGLHCARSPCSAHSCLHGRTTGRGKGTKARRERTEVIVRPVLRVRLCPDWRVTVWSRVDPKPIEASFR